MARPHRRREAAAPGHDDPEGDEQQVAQPHDLDETVGPDQVLGHTVHQREQQHRDDRQANAGQRRRVADRRGMCRHGGQPMERVGARPGT